MTHSPDSEPHIDHIVLLILFILLVFASPLVFWWMNPGSAWYLPYLFWLLVIVAGAWIFKRRGRHDP